MGLFGQPATVGAYIDTWYEVVPEEVKDGTAPDHSVPMWLMLHGGGDDPLQFLDEMGFMTLAGEERFAMIAPIHGDMFTVGDEVLPAVVEYFLEKYPALDPSRVYVTGYSMGAALPCMQSMATPSFLQQPAPMQPLFLTQKMRLWIRMTLICRSSLRLQPMIFVGMAVSPVMRRFRIPMIRTILNISIHLIRTGSMTT